MSTTSTPVPFTHTVKSEEDLPISKYRRNFLQQEETEFPQQDLTFRRTHQHVTEFPQQELSEPQQLQQIH